MFLDFAQATLSHYSRTIRAVSSVVEHLVYTERVGGSSPSPPRSISIRSTPLRVAQDKFLDFRFAIDGFGLATPNR